MNALSVNNLCFSYENAPSAAVDDVSFELKKGSYTALVGMNGSGKSTLARIAAGLLEPGSGSVKVNRNMKVGIVFQSPRDQIICSSVRRDTAFGPVNEGLPDSEVELRLIESLSSVNMLQYYNRRSLDFSLGQMQKLAFSSILAISPDILILDEVTAMLDQQAREEIYKLLDELNEHGTTILHITHDIYGVERASDVIMMRSGKIVWGGTSRAFYSNKSLVLELCGEKLKKSTVKKVGPRTVSLNVNNLAFSYGANKVLKDVSFDLEAGSLVALTGASGSGKSTLLELLAGLLSLQSGTIHGCCRPVLCQQNCDAALFENFAGDDVAFGLRNQGFRGKELVRRVKNAMDAVNLPFEKFAERQTFSLSGGEKRRLAVAGIIALDSDILLFDEPSVALDGESRYMIMNLMRTLADQGRTVLFTTHNRDEAAFADRVIHIENGCILTGGKSRKEGEFIEPERLKEIKAVSNSFMLDGFRKVVFGRNAGNGILGRVPAILRGLLFIGFFIGTALVWSLKGCGLMFLLSVLYCVLAGHSLKDVLKSIVKIFPFILIFLFFQILFGVARPEDTIILSKFGFSLTAEKLLVCMETLLHTECALCAILAYTNSVTEDDIIDSVSKLFYPLKKTGFPVRYAVVLVELIFRFLPLLAEETACIIKTQLVRGGLGKAKGIIRKIRAVIPLIVPLVIQTIKKANILADAMAARGLK